MGRALCKAKYGTVCGRCFALTRKITCQNQHSQYYHTDTRVRMISVRLQKMNKEEAKMVLSTLLAKYRRKTYADLKYSLNEQGVQVYPVLR